MAKVEAKSESKPGTADSKATAAAAAAAAAAADDDDDEGDVDGGGGAASEGEDAFLSLEGLKRSSGRADVSEVGSIDSMTVVPAVVNVLLGGVHRADKPRYRIARRHRCLQVSLGIYKYL